MLTMNKVLHAASSGRKAYKSLNDKIEKVQGVIDDIKKFQEFASHLFHRRPGSSSKILKLSYEGATRLAGLLPKPSFLGSYLQAYQPGIDALALLWKLEDESKLVTDWSYNLHQTAEPFVGSIDEILKEYSYGRDMVNCDGHLPRNLPKGFEMYFLAYSEYEDSVRDLMRSFGNVDWRKALQAMDAIGFHAEYAQNQFDYVLQRKQVLSLGVIGIARDIAASHAHFSHIYAQVENAGEKAGKTMKRLNKSDNAAERFAGSATERNMQIDYYLHNIADGGKRSGKMSGLDSTDVTKIAAGNWRDTKDFKRMTNSMTELRLLANDWSKWAKRTADGNLFIFV